MQNEPLIQWPQPIFEFLEFVGVFLAAGAVGFRYGVVRVARRVGGPADSAAYDHALRLAAALGVAGAGLILRHVATGLPAAAARAHTTVEALLSSPSPASASLLFAVLALIGFVLALLRSNVGWALAAIGVVAWALRAALFGQFPQLVKPVHLLAGGLWIGTLFVLVVAGLGVVLRREDVSDRRGALAVAMVRAFSRMALVFGAVLAGCGLVLVFRELERLDQLWTTPYGLALCAKLLVVAVVFSLGAWNWRRQKPRLGSEPAARDLRRSATAELIAALVVLILTSLLVSLPAPKGP